MFKFLSGVLFHTILNLFIIFIQIINFRSMATSVVQDKAGIERFLLQSEECDSEPYISRAIPCYVRIISVMVI